MSIDFDEVLKNVEYLQFPGELNAGIKIIRMNNAWVVQDWAKADDVFFDTFEEAYLYIRDSIEIWQEV